MTWGGGGGATLSQKGEILDACTLQGQIRKITTQSLGTRHSEIFLVLDIFSPLSLPKI